MGELTFGFSNKKNLLVRRSKLTRKNLPLITLKRKHCQGTWWLKRDASFPMKGGIRVLGCLQ